MNKILLIAFGTNTNPIGLYSIYDYLGRKGFDVDFLHLWGLTSLPVEIIGGYYDIVGISSSTVTRHLLPRVMASVRERFPNAKLVLGGRHFQPDVLDMLLDLDVKTANHIVIGDGEYAMEGIANGSENDHIIYGRPFEFEDFIEMEFPSPQFVKRYMLARPERKKPAVLLSRGCMFNCHFCSESRKVLTPDPDEAALYISCLEGFFRWKRLFIYDDIFGLNMNWLERFILALKNRKVQMRFQVFVHGKTLTEEKLDAFIEMGVDKLSLGAESGDDRVLKTINKRATTADYVKVHEMVKRRKGKIQLHCLWMIGNMGETLESLDATYRLSRAIGTDGNPFFGYAIPYPGSVFWQKRKEFGTVKTYDWKQWNNRELIFIPHGLTERDLRSAYRKCRSSK